MSTFGELLHELPRRLGDHVILSGAALAIGVGFSLPLALAVSKIRWLRMAVVGTAGVIQTIPGLALLALMVPLFGSFGFGPALAALVLYSMLPVLQNTVAGIAGVDPELREAATGLGMTPRQILTRVEVPLALPVIVAGIRTSAVWVVGTATLSTPVGQPSLGNYIFGGLQTRNYAAVLIGCVSAAALAIVLDTLLGAVENAVAAKNRRRALLALGAVVGLFAFGAILPLLSRARAQTPSAIASPTSSATAEAAPTRVRVGAKTFTEQYVLAEAISNRLEHAGFEVEHVESLGSTVIFDALSASKIDVYVDYSGTLWANAMKRNDVPPAWRVKTEVEAWLAEKHGIRSLGALGFENAYALAMRRARARELGVHDIQALARVAPRLAIGGDYEIFQRPEWTRVKSSYGLEFSSSTTFDSSFMYDAVRRGSVDVITAFSSDGRIQAFELEVLADPKAAFPPYEALLLLSPRVANDTRVVDALAPMVGRVNVERMREANLLVDRDQDKFTPAHAAESLLANLKLTDPTSPSRP